MAGPGAYSNARAMPTTFNADLPQRENPEIPTVGLAPSRWRIEHGGV